MYFVSILSVTEEKGRIRIRIRTKMKQIHNTHKKLGTETYKLCNPTTRPSSVADPDPPDPHVFGPSIIMQK